MTPRPGVHREPVGQAPDGTPVESFRLRSRSGLEAQILTWGATLAALRVPDRGGTPGDVVLGFDDLEGYLGPHPYFGATVGRYANRIGGARFVLDGTEYQLARNEGAHHLHGGVTGFDRRVWEADAIDPGDSPGVRLRLVSPHGEQGYPGRLEATIRYRLTEAAELRLDFHATTDRPTVVNLTNHSYFDLSGGGAGDILDHELWIDADRYTPVDGDGIPTGDVAPVKGTPLDFTTPARIGARIHALPSSRGGYDHNYVRNAPGASLAEIARLRDPRSGRVMRVRTTQPGVQLYTGNHLDGTLVGRAHRTYGRWSGLCLETQHFPDSPNHPHFPSPVLRPGQAYAHTTVYGFPTEPAGR